MTDTRPKTIRLHKPTIEAVEKLAEEENRNFSNMVETILKKVMSSDLLINKMRTINKL